MQLNSENTINMPRDEIYSVIRTPVSIWHRKQHDLVALTDIDHLSICPGCAKSLLICDTIYNVDGQFREKSEWLQRPYIEIATALNIPYFLVFYTVNEKSKERSIVEFNIKKKYPEPTNNLIKLTPDEFLQYLERKVQNHIPVCNAKEYLKKRLNKQTVYNQTLTRKHEYEKILY